MYCICVCVLTLYILLSFTTDDLGYATEMLNHSQMNTVERDLVDADVHNVVLDLLADHSSNPFIQEHGLAALEHLGDHMIST